MRRTLLAAALVLPLSPAFAAAGTTPGAPLAPRTGWVIDYADTFCTATRGYGDPEDGPQLAFRPAPNDELVQIAVLRRGAYLPAEHTSVTVSFADEELKTTALHYFVKKSGHRVALISVPAAAAAHLAQAKTITVKGGAGLDFTFAVPAIEKVVPALATCNADLRAQWNIMTGNSVAPRPITPLGRLITSEDYPRQAIDERATGLSRVSLLVDEQGRVRDCLLLATSGNASLDAMTCIVIQQRAKFEPGRSASGKPVKGAFFQSVSWRIQG